MSAPDPATEPWAKFSWLLATPWLVFLVFPVTGILQAPAPWWLRVFALTAVLAFAGTYLFGFITNARTPVGSARNHVILAILFVLTAPVFAVVGLDAFGMFTFPPVYAVFSQPLRRAIILAGGLVVIVATTVLLAGSPERLLYAGTITGTTLFVGLIRWIDDRHQEREVLERQLTVTAERERVARDVHDVLGHSLTVVTVKAELAERLIEADPVAAKAEIAAIRSLTREALGELRATVSGLRVARLADELTAAQEALTDAGIDADVPTDPAVVDPRHRIVVAWVLREAITNVVRHSGAGRCEVSLGSSSLVVADDGVGPGGAAEAGGLRGARERVDAAGGTLTVRPGETGGTRVEVRW
ncbi:sensor histidine kinase [Ruania alkalisoli]|uniref:Sensor histidine kinase n=1 Tax=Ruania alkalisoli TaxID=2779775 RepID=A0A7M1ST48_9MICO|nr:histidine kinase [Ruania alkalisoli]QOR70675.1 sensor histidine kinase [Ruania alkalisoli]